MDWETNLAAIIKCTDASLAQQFRQFEDITAEFTAVEETPVRSGGHDPNENVAATYLRETMAAEHRNRQQEQQQPRASYSRVSGAFTRGSAPSVAPATTFSEHFHRRQERKRTARDNQRVHRRGSEYEPAEDEGQQDDNAPRYAASRQAGSAYQQQMYSSPSYDVAQMMEQVRLSLKLEVDARAAIAERQLSALLQLCKATSEELDRLRVEVCANDRQLHTLDQVQSKIRQELTTQKDIGFHLQSMCGKDESWRMQTENQLLELRQMVAALREQGNSTQTLAQEKLSRSELLVQFNAAMEPIKAQLQANLQHQSQQIADITRTTSSSSLLLDGITQKVNRGMTEELSELRSDLNALKHHVTKMDIFQNGGKGPSQPSKEEQEAKETEEKKHQERKLTELREGLQKELLTFVKTYVKEQIKPIRQTVDESGSTFANKYDVDHLRSALEEGCRNRCAAAVIQVDGQIKLSQDQLRGECSAAVRDSSDRTEKLIQQATNAVTVALEGRVSCCQNQHLDLVKLAEKEGKERKQALEELHESVRKKRHQLEDQLHTLVQESRSNLSLQNGDFDKRLKDVEKQFENAIIQAQKETQFALTSLKDSFQTRDSNNIVELKQKLKRLEETVSRTDESVASLTKCIASLPPTNPPPPNDTSAKDVSVALEKQTNMYVSTMESLFQKMQLQLQLQTQPQVQMMTPSPYHGFWPPSPYATSQPPPPPLLHLPATLSTAATTTAATSTPSVSAASVPFPCPAPVTSPAQDKFEKNPENEIKEKSDDLVRSALPVSATVVSPPSLSSPPPVAITLKAAIDHSDPPYSSKEDTGNTRENTVATTAKGAMAEAELAKARVESRRKIEQEMKQQQQKLPPKSAEPGASGGNLSDAVSAGNHRFSVTGQPSVLTRSASSSALPGPAAVSPAVVFRVGDKPLAPASVPSTPTATRFPPNIPLPAPPQSTRAEEVTYSLNVSSFSTTPNQNSVKMDSKPPSISSIVPSTPPTGPKLPIASTIPSTPRASTPSVLASSNSRPDLTISVPSVSATDEAKLSLSPLAKMFARPTTTFDDVKEDESSALSANISTIDLVKKDPSPTITPPAIEAPVSHVLCEFCRLPVRSDLKIQHEKEMCPKRMVECVSCKQQLQWVNLEIHELECSTVQRRRTDTAISTEVKPLSDGTTASALDLGGSLKKCRHCSADIQSLDLLEHEINCDKVLKQCPHCLRRQKMSELQDHIENCDCRLVSCPNDCGGKFLQRGIPNHLATRCPKKLVTTSAPVATSTIIETSKPTLPVSQPPSTIPPNGKVECKFCDDEIEVSKVDDHEQNCDWKPKRCQHCNMVVISRDLLRHETSCKTNVKSCSHCNENMPQSALTTHGSRCSKRPIKCIRCCQLFPADTIVAHSTNCKFVPGTNPAASSASPQPIANASRAPIKIPPPPPFPPPSTSTTPVSTPPPTRRSSADSPAKVEETASDRLARRNLVLSQLTNPSVTPTSSPRASAPSLQLSGLQSRPIIQPDGRDHVETEAVEDEEDDDEVYGDEDDNELTLAQVVKEWSVENVCLWLHEDVGVPGVVLRFQQKQCNGEMLLELTESDLINDFGVKDRVQRERILSAIEAINTSTFSDEDENDDEDENSDEDLEESEGYEATSSSPSSHIRNSIGAASFGHPRDILRRKSQPSPQKLLGGELPSSNDMLRRISNALESPKALAGTSSTHLIG